MKGISFVTDVKNKKKAVMIEMSTLLKNEQAVQDMLDAIIAESRKDEPKKKWSDVKKSLQGKGKL